jgi:transcription elongation factor GreA
MSVQKFRITREGYNNMKLELDNYINNERPSIAKAIADAMELGDLKENEEYTTAKDKLKVIESMIATLSDRLVNAQVVDLKHFTSDIIDFGATIKLLDLNTNKETNYQLVSEFEADIDKGKLAIESLVGKALIGKKKGDEIEVKTPSGTKEYEVLDIIY